MNGPLEPNRSHVFTLHLWREKLGAAQYEWRGRIRRINQGEGTYFRDWQTLVHFLQDNLNAAGTNDPISSIQERRSEMSIESTRAVMNRFFNSEHTDGSVLADDVVFTVMGTGQEHRGPEAVLGMLNYLYHVAFDATTIFRSVVYAEQQAVGEWDFAGRHIGDFAGIPATGKEVRVPLCVVYELENDKIKHGRVYFQDLMLLQQLGVQPAAVSQ